MKIPNAKATFLFRLADIIPRSKMKGFSGILILNSLPPEPPKNRDDFFYEGFWQKDVLHEVDGNRSKDRINVSDTTCMIFALSEEHHFLLSKLKSGKVKAKFIGTHMKGKLPRQLWVPKALVAHVKGPKLAWVPKPQK